MRSRFEHVTWSAEYQSLASVNADLSQAYARSSAYISVHEVAAQDPHPSFNAALAAFLSHGRCPYWGKTHDSTMRKGQDFNPQFREFLDVRHELDLQSLYSKDRQRQIIGLPQ